MPFLSFPSNFSFVIEVWEQVFVAFVFNAHLLFIFSATLPPSFAVEVFVQCEGETRFRRLCHPFLYSHSSSNVLEVEVINCKEIYHGTLRDNSLDV